MSDSDEDDLGFVPGTVIESSKNKYVIVKLLGAGGFGAMYALKVEKKIETRKHSKLKMEVRSTSKSA
ncbi:hypothetical protein OSTOST_03779 [Ostertagia ostertagi]